MGDRDDLVVLAPDHEYGHVEAGEVGPVGLATVREHLVGNRAQGFVHPVHALEAQFVVDEPACDEVGVREQEPQNALHLPAPVRGDKALDVVFVDLLPKPGAVDEHERRHPLAVCERERAGHRTTHRVSYQVRLLHTHLVHKARQNSHEGVEVALAYVLGGLAVAGQVEGVDGASRLGEGLLVEDPDVDVAAEAVQKDEGRTFALPDLQVLYVPAADLDCLRFGTASLRCRQFGVEVLQELLDVRIYLLVGDVRRRDHAEQTAHGQDLALPGDPAAKDALGRRLDGVVDLLALDLDDLVALGKLGTLLEEPLDDRSFCHREAPLGHPQLEDSLRLAHARAPAPATSRAASAIRSGSGTYRSSSEGLNGGGVCGAVTIFGAAFRSSKQFSATRAAMSVAMLQRGFDSSTTTSRPVFSTLSKIVSSSSGEVVLGSTISHSIPSSASDAAACSAIETIRPIATIVTSSPSRTYSASPRGIA